MIVECRPDGVAANPSQQPLGGSVVHDPLAMEVEAVVVDGPTIVSPTLPSSSASVIEVIADGDVPRPAGARPSAPVLADVGCQTDVGMCPSVATQASIVPPPRWIATAESQTPPPPVCQDGGTCVQREVACCVRQSNNKKDCTSKEAHSDYMPCTHARFDHLQHYYPNNVALAKCKPRRQSILLLQHVRYYLT